MHVAATPEHGVGQIFPQAPQFAMSDDVSLQPPSQQFSHGQKATSYIPDPSEVHVMPHPELRGLQRTTGYNPGTFETIGSEMESEYFKR